MENTGKLGENDTKTSVQREKLCSESVPHQDDAWATELEPVPEQETPGGLEGSDSQISKGDISPLSAESCDSAFLESDGICHLTNFDEFETWKDCAPADSRNWAFDTSCEPIDEWISLALDVPIV